MNEPGNGVRVRIGTRGSALARWQAEHVSRLLRSAWPGLQVDIEVFGSRGDRLPEVPLPTLGGKGVFTEDLEAALREGRIDLAVHSLKDLPVEPAAGLKLGAILSRGDARDAVISRGKMPLADLPSGAVVGTSSPRRTAQLRRLRPDLGLSDIRGNVDTRVAKVLEHGEYDAIVLAAAGLERLGLQSVVAERIPLNNMLPAPGQAALAVQCRDEAQSLSLLSPLNHVSTQLCTMAERAMLAALGGGCALPVAALASVEDAAGGDVAAIVIRLHGRVNALSGSAQLDVVVTMPVPDVPAAIVLGEEAARQLIDQGARDLLEGSGP